MSVFIWGQKEYSVFIFRHVLDISCYVTRLLQIDRSCIWHIKCLVYFFVSRRIRFIETKTCYRINRQCILFIMCNIIANATVHCAIDEQFKSRSQRYRGKFRRTQRKCCITHTCFTNVMVLGWVETTLSFVFVIWLAFLKTLDLPILLDLWICSLLDVFKMNC